MSFIKLYLLHYLDLFQNFTVSYPCNSGESYILAVRYRNSFDTGNIRVIITETLEYLPVGNLYEPQTAPTQVLKFNNLLSNDAILELFKLYESRNIATLFDYSTFDNENQPINGSLCIKRKENDTYELVLTANSTVLWSNDNQSTEIIGWQNINQDDGIYYSENILSIDSTIDNTLNGLLYGLGYMG